ncbi:hypothetical protein RJ639_007453 [Escallonia herrerae]|uniref:FAR1 domain-containing protein n=1 Tax=Escallonia herrerae TaxID=1293975 RepID=A0AA89AUX5_9ASTE|nr:hypothetical protein RJ639_007453 [Escallonia herrerae]
MAPTAATAITYLILKNGERRTDSEAQVGKTYAELAQETGLTNVASRDWKIRNLNGNEKVRRDLRTGCKAMMQVTLSNKLGVLVVDKFQDVHNHPLTTTPSKVVKYGYHIKYHRTNVCKSLVSDINKEA